MVFRRMTAAVALATVAMLAVTTPAFAHAELTGSNPAKGASLDTAPRQIQLTFNEPVSPESITVAGPQGAQWTVGQIAVEGAVVTAPVQAVGPAGQYAITYKVKSDDGDSVTGTVAFTMTAAATAPTTTTTSSGQAAPASSSNDDGGVPSWVWILIIIAVLLAVGAVIGRRVAGRGETSASEASTSESVVTDKRGRQQDK